MQSYLQMSRQQLQQEKENLLQQYHAFQARNLKLDMSRGKPGADQLELSNGMLELGADQLTKAEDGADCRNYGLLDGLPEAKKLFAEILEAEPEEIIVGGNSSLNLMYDTIARAMIFGVLGSEKPWGKYDKIKFLCPVPGYDRHFAICEQFGIEMIAVPMTENGPAMNVVREMVESDPSIKGIWCVPKYSNPDGITYSADTVRQFANLQPAAKDFRIFWDNAYVVHDLTEKSDSLENILDLCKKNGHPNMVFMFASTSKVSFPGAGVAVVAASKENIEYMKKQMFFQTIGFDKINQLRHVKFFKNAAGIRQHMQKHAAILRPKFECVFKALEQIDPLEIGHWKKPNGGYFISYFTLEGCAKRVVQLCKEAGVVLTGAGATYPYGKDPADSNIRIAPTFPPVEELEVAMELFCLCVKLASVEKLLGK